MSGFTFISNARGASLVYLVGFQEFTLSSVGTKIENPSEEKLNFYNITGPDLVSFDKHYTFSIIRAMETYNHPNCVKRSFHL